MLERAWLRDQLHREEQAEPDSEQEGAPRLLGAGLPLETKLAKGTSGLPPAQARLWGGRATEPAAGQEGLGVPGRGGTEVHLPKSHSLACHFVCSDQ